MSPGRQRAAWAAVAATGVLLVFAPAVVGLRTLARRDTDRLYAPVRTLVVEELRAGRLPLWNPYEATGKPLLAEGIHGVLHPISLLAAAVAPSSIDALLIAYLVAAALGAFTLAAGLGASGPASVAAGVAFALSGFSVSMTGNLVFLAGLATLPWVLAAARAAGAGARWGAVSTALATACAFFAGDTQVALVGLALGLLLAADAGGPRGALRALAAAAAGVLLAAVQIAPTRSLLALSSRSAGLHVDEKAHWSLAPARVFEWVIPGLFRGPLRASPPPVVPEPFAESVHLGAPLLFVAAGACLRRERRRTPLVLGGAAAALLWIALGPHLGARQLLDVVPVWNQFRYSEKLMAPLALCLCALGALGVDATATAPFARGQRIAAAVVVAAAAAALAGLLLAPDAADALARSAGGDAGPFYRATLAGGLPYLVLGVAALLAADRVRDAGRRRLAVGAAVALAAAAAVPFGAHLGDPRAHRFETPLRMPGEEPPVRLYHPEDRVFVSDESSGAIDSTAQVEEAILLPAINVAHRVDAMILYGPFEPLRVDALASAFQGEWSRGFRRYGVTHVVAQVPEGTDVPAVRGGRLVQHAERFVTGLWAVPHRPWAFFAEGALAAAGPEAALRAVLDLLARGEDGAVVVEGTTAPATAPGRVLAMRRETDRVSIEAEAAAPALLVVQDAYWPGWRATIDGEPAELLPADALVRAVRWPAGRHRLEMTYDPPELRIGLALSAAGALVVLALALVAWRVPAAPGRG